MANSRYRLGEKIHESVKASIHRGVDTQDSRQVVLKILQPERHRPQDGRQMRLNREFMLLQRFSCDEVIGVYTCENDSQMLVLEDFSGPSLRQLLAGQPEGPLWPIEDFLT